MNENAIAVKNLVKKFGSFTANDMLTFDVGRGEIFGFLGANGAGKTTAIRILCGLSKPTSGEVFVAGFDVCRQSEQVKRNIGYMCQKFSLYEDLTVSENMLLYGGIYGMSRGDIRRRMEELLQKLDFTRFRDTLIGRLPTGHRQKLAFSAAIFHKPSIVFLDEPTGGVDPVTRRNFWELIYEASDSGITVFVTTHYMDEAEYCNRVSVINEGRIVALDTPAVLREKYNAASIDEVFVKIVRPVNQKMS